MGRLYTGFIGNTGGTAAAVDLFEITSAAGKGVALHSFWLWPYDGMGFEKIIGLTLRRGSSNTTAGSGGFSPSFGAVRWSLLDAAASFTFTVRNDTLMSGGTITTLRAWTWDHRVMCNKVFTPETRPVIWNGERLVLRMESAFGWPNTRGWQSSFVVEELT